MTVLLGCLTNSSMTLMPFVEWIPPQIIVFLVVDVIIIIVMSITLILFLVRTIMTLSTTKHRCSTGTTFTTTTTTTGTHLYVQGYSRRKTGAIRWVVTMVHFVFGLITTRHGLNRLLRSSLSSSTSQRSS